MSAPSLHRSSLSTGPTEVSAVSFSTSPLTSRDGAASPHVVAVIPVLNAADTLVRCLESLLVQPDLPPASILVVDNGSTDDSLHLASTRGVRTLTCSKRGPSAARNTALREVGPEQCDYVLFLDADVELPPGWLTRALAFVESAGPGCAGVGGPGRSPGSTTVERALDASLWNWVLGSSTGTRVAGLATMNALFRYSAVRGHWFRDDLLTGEDPEFCFQLRDAGYSLLAFRELTVIHRNPTTLRGVGLKWYRYGLNYLSPYVLHPNCIGPQVVLRALYLPLALAGIVLVASLRGVRAGAGIAALTLALPWAVLFGKTVSRSGRLRADSGAITLVQWVRFCAHLIGIWVGILEMRPLRARHGSQDSRALRANDLRSRR